MHHIDCMKPKNDIVFTLLKETVISARTGGYSDAASKLNACLQELQPLLRNGKIPAAELKKLAFSLETILLMQKQNDWVAVADVIEFELLLLLEQALS